MSTPPARPKIYHITHVENLAAIVDEGKLVSDAAMIERGGPAASIGMSSIKRRRLGLEVDCHPGDRVGDYVPFYFCPRSIMLYVIHCANHPELTYRGGQGPIVHLEADLHSVVAWAREEGRRWAFSLSNAGANYAEFRHDVADLTEVNWAAVRSTDFRSAEVKEDKQAEFLVLGSFPWLLVERMGVSSVTIQRSVEAAMAGAAHRPPVEVKRDWYY
ncbi:MAG: type II toxin-antitoxin system toxin DNA ADP-ribosyl transferase DarT [Dehalococcoidia bacterium]